MPGVSLGEIVDFVGGEFTGARDHSIVSVGALSTATADQLSFLSNPKYAAELAATRAGAVLVPKKLGGADPRWVRVADPYFAFAKIMTRWFSNRPMPTGISPKAVVAPSAKLGDNVTLGHFAIIGDDVVIGNNVTIFQGVSIETGSIVGDDCIIYPNVTIYDGTRIGRRCIIHAGVVIGSDGYGFALHEGRHHKIPQIGIVRIEDDV
jgi:UDP-3-O-[3-hydroxymyristoyl] glucosamine N-acyltransferase